MPRCVLSFAFCTNAPQIRVARPPEKPQAARIDAPELDLDEVFVEALEVVVLAALEQIGDDPETRFRFFRRLLVAAEEEAVGRYLS